MLRHTPKADVVMAHDSSARTAFFSPTGAYRAVKEAIGGSILVITPVHSRKRDANNTLRIMEEALSRCLTFEGVVGRGNPQRSV